MEPLEWIAAANGLVQLIKMLKGQKDALDRTNAWTDEERALRDQAWARIKNSHAWLTDEEGGT